MHGKNEDNTDTGWQWMEKYKSMKPTFPDILPSVDGEQFAQSPVVAGRSHELLLADLTVMGKVHQTKLITSWCLRDNKLSSACSDHIRESIV